MVRRVAFDLFNLHGILAHGSDSWGEAHREYDNQPCQLNPNHRALLLPGVRHPSDREDRQPTDN